MARAVIFFLSFFCLPLTALAQGRSPSRCLAIAEALPNVVYASIVTAQTGTTDGDVTITYAGHSTYLIESSAGVRIATDYSGIYGNDPLPDVVTMNKAHRTHFTDTPPPGIAHVLRGWNPSGGPASHALTIDDVYIRNVPTDIRSWGGELERDGNSIFIFETAGLCIGHLGHLHTRLNDAQYGAVGRLDVVMVPIDGGLTLSLPVLSEIITRLRSSIVLPMHRHSTPIDEFTNRLRDKFAVEVRDGPSLELSQKTLPSQPTIIVLDGV
ncbi:MBL fold metallo-hydrolase [Mesorhizobium sp. NPDC059054]|uniref:MBL fold metallo-hydrolase n=1 Tax=Mesorhizobium sp. NPDC059054 TaxID=3346711 RepID=UPI0036752ED9